MDVIVKSEPNIGKYPCLYSSFIGTRKQNEASPCILGVPPDFSALGGFGLDLLLLGAMPKVTSLFPQLYLIA